MKSIGLAFALWAGIGSACREEWGYLLQQAPGQFSLLLHREKIVKILKSPGLEPETKSKLELVLAVKQYAEDQIGLVHNANYTVYAPIDREAVVWTLSACPPLSFQAKTWKFPIVGEAPYLGFFQKADGEKKQAQLEAEGYDVYLRPAGAYSMLGIAADPIYSPLLHLSDAELANLVVHELTHATIWVPGQVEFNESVALFIGNQGALEFLQQRFGPDSDQVREALGANEDDKIFSVFLGELYQELDLLYQSHLSEPEKLKRKAEIIAENRQRFRDQVLPRMKTDNYQRFPDSVINNASILQRKLYYKEVSLYYRVFEAHHRNLPATVEFFKEQAQRGGEVENAIREWLETQPP